MKIDELIIERIDPNDEVKTAELMANLELFRSGYVEILKSLSPDRIANCMEQTIVVVTSDALLYG